MTDSVFAVILAGGSGTRFWPVSRKAKPKQFLALGSTEESLIQATGKRISPLLSVPDSLMVVTNTEQSALVRQHLPSALVVTEPCAKNTAASIGLAALAVKRRDPQGVMIVLPADHSVSDEQTLREVLSRAVKVASSQDSLVTIGIRPESPNTAYGYIQRGQQHSPESYQVARFFEKPNFERAKSYCAAGNFYWNSGMFVWKASTILNAFEKHMPKLAAALKKIDAATDSSDAAKVLENEFETLESISIDFGVLEHASNCMVVDAKPFGWNDVGSWDAWAHHFEADAEGNVKTGEVLQVQSSNCITYSVKDSKKLIALLGVENLVVVDTPDALLLCDRSKVQDVKLVVDALRKQGREDLL